MVIWILQVEFAGDNKFSLQMAWTGIDAEVNNEIQS